MVDFDGCGMIWGVSSVEYTAPCRFYTGDARPTHIRWSWALEGAEWVTDPTPFSPWLMDLGDPDPLDPFDVGEAHPWYALRESPENLAAFPPVCYTQEQAAGTAPVPELLPDGTIAHKTRRLCPSGGAALGGAAPMYRLITGRGYGRLAAGLRGRGSVGPPPAVLCDGLGVLAAGLAGAGGVVSYLPARGGASLPAALAGSGALLVPLTPSGAGSVLGLAAGAGRAAIPPFGAGSGPLYGALAGVGSGWPSAVISGAGALPAGLAGAGSALSIPARLASGAGALPAGLAGSYLNVAAQPVSGPGAGDLAVALRGRGAGAVWETVVSGDFCAVAPLLADNHHYLFLFYSAESAWFRFPFVTGGLFTVVIDAGSDPFTMEIRQGSCPSPPVVVTMPYPLLTSETITPAALPLYLRFTTAADPVVILFSVYT